MNSLKFILFTALMIMYVDAMFIDSNKNSDCEKNLFVKRCSGCSGVCNRVDKNMTDTWMSNISEMLTSNEGVNVFAKYLHGCNLTREVKLLEIFMKSNQCKPYKQHPYFNKSNDLFFSRAMRFLTIHKVLYEAGDLNAIKDPHHLAIYTGAVQYFIREEMMKEYSRFQKKLSKDIEQLGKYEVYVCYN